MKIHTILDERGRDIVIVRNSTLLSKMILKNVILGSSNYDEKHLLGWKKLFSCKN